VYVSSDNAASWYPSGLQGKAIYKYAVGELGMYASVGDTLYRTNDGGKTWQQIKVFGGIRITDILPRTAVLYVSVYDENPSIGGLYRSYDDGDTWTKTTKTSEFTYIRGLYPAGPSVMAATKNNGIYRSLNGGITWEKASNGLTDDPEIYDISGYENYIYVAGNMCFFYSSNGGDSWITPQNNGLDSSSGFQFYTITRQGKRIFASMFGYFESIMFSDDNGNNWYNITPGQNLPTSVSPYAFSAIGKDCYVQIGNGIFRTSDGGVTWSEHNKGIPALISDVGFSDGDTLVAWGPTGLFKTGNGGNTWVHHRGIDDSWIKVTGAINFKGSNYLYGDSYWQYNSSNVIPLGTGASDVVHFDTALVSLTDQGFRYSSSGADWDSYTIPQIPDSLGYLMRLVSSGTSLIAYTSNETLDTNVWYRYTKGGSWQKVHEGGYSSRILSSAVHKGVFYIGTEYGGLMRSEDDGLTWKQGNSVDPSAIFDVTYVTGDHLLFSFEFYGFFRVSNCCPKPKIVSCSQI